MYVPRNLLEATWAMGVPSMSKGGLINLILVHVGLEV